MADKNLIPVLTSMDPDLVETFDSYAAVYKVRSKEGHVPPIQRMGRSFLVREAMREYAERHKFEEFLTNGGHP